MHNRISGRPSRLKSKTSIHHNPDAAASTGQISPGLLTPDDLRLLVASMVD